VVVGGGWRWLAVVGGGWWWLAVVVGGGGWRWWLAVVVGGGGWRWLLAVVVGGGWRLLLAVVVGGCCWRLFVGVCLLAVVVGGCCWRLLLAVAPFFSDISSLSFLGSAEEGYLSTTSRATSTLALSADSRSHGFASLVPRRRRRTLRRTRTDGMSRNGT
jgi:hypothetical protein